MRPYRIVVFAEDTDVERWHGEEAFTVYVVPAEAWREDLSEAEAAELTVAEPYRLGEDELNPVT